MKFKYFLFLLLLSCSSRSFAQKQGREKIDSLRGILKKLEGVSSYPSDTNRINVLNDISFELSTIDPDSAIILSKKALQLSQKMDSAYPQLGGWKQGIAYSCFYIGRACYLKSDFALSLEYLFKSLNVWRMLENKASKDELFRINKKKSSIIGFIAVDYQNLSDYSKALQFYIQAIELDKSLNNKNGVARHLGNIGILYMNQGNYSKAIEYYFKALKINEELRDKAGIARSYGNLGVVYDLEGDLNKALILYLKALKLDEEIENNFGAADWLDDIGIIYTKQENYEKAIEYFDRALKTNGALGNRVLIENVLGHLGIVYSKQGDSAKQDSIKRIKYSKALDYFFQAIKLNEELGNQSTNSAWLGSIGLIYTSQKKYELAKKYLEHALAIAQQFKSLEDIETCNENLSYFYKESNDYKKALSYYENAITAKDSLFNQDKTKEITQHEMTYEFEKKQDSTKAVQDKKAAIANQEIAKQKIIRNSIIGGSGGLALIGFLGFVNFRNKRKREKAELSQQVSATEMKALRSQMNPHFIFNALQSIQTFLLSNKSEDANLYLLKFSKLMRAVLENSQHSEVPLEDDMQALELYMQLESIRLPHPFTYQFHIDESVDVENDTIPPLILQPFVENAIWHGLQYKPESGHINIYLSKKDNALRAVVEDNGIGRDMSKKVAEPMLLKKKSLGMKLTEERLKVLNEVRKVKAQFKIVDLLTSENKAAGTRVELELPIAI